MDNIDKVLSKIKDSDKVLDIGGWAKPLNRADFVIDYMPYETRGEEKREHYGRDREYFTKDTWVEWDVCDRKSFPFKDKEFNFVFCSHLLEDIRDPLWVCSEMNRIGKAGYIETPSRVIESHKNIGGKWNLNKYVTGYSHHRWYIENINGKLLFTFKNPLIHFIKEFQVNHIKEPEAMSFFWENGFEYKENPIDANSYKSIFADLKRFKLSTLPKSKKGKAGKKMDKIAKKMQSVQLSRKIKSKLKRYGR